MGHLASEAEAPRSVEPPVVARPVTGAVVPGAADVRGQGSAEESPGQQGRWSRPAAVSPEGKPRAFNPVEGRFLSVDPIEGGCANADAYVSGNPRPTPLQPRP
jgi:hypothetical protein